MIALLTLLACGTSTPAEADPDPAAVAAVANAVQAAPANAEAVLTEHGWTAADFEARLYEIAADPALTKQYLDAR